MARVLIIAGSDSGGGAGIQADIKTITCLGGYAMTAVTAVTVQNTLGVTGIHAVPAEIVAAQMRACIEDIGIDVVKIGMIGSAETVRAVAGVLAEVRVPIVLDPVMVAKGGANLLEDDAIAALIECLLPLAAVVTPNTPELMALAGTEIEDVADALLAAQELLLQGPGAVLAKGGHLEGDVITDWLVTRGGHVAFTGPRVVTRHTHGTGCTLASALACGLGQGMTLEEAVVRARAFVMQAIARAPGLGGGHGPLGFFPL
ncbi:hydroxymethylpyrimidine/phosphomethylpyrimidine kinase [Polymorphobacter glacialis]|uniref:hydroxymethylpyrimidine kinase n=1 Tax=Sandarakinorhabdus glacialis TaxID=1614636 RepID=A0A917E6I3_9SPHN|nr:hydroxymethylpyrimidine/phosphomethylpyrimidine kinase [Polymorphobacter glacialis]